MRVDQNGKRWGTWREWMTLGRKDARTGREAEYPQQLDYMSGYTSEKLNSAFIN